MIDQGLIFYKRPIPCRKECPIRKIRYFTQLAKYWYTDEISKESASLAFYTIFAIAPVVLISVSVASLAYSDEEIRYYLLNEATRLLGAGASEALKTTLNNLLPKSNEFTASAVGILTFLLGALWVFTSIQDAMNKIFRVQPRADRALRYMVWDYLVCYVLLAIIGLIFLFSLLVSSILPALQIYWPHFLGSSNWILFSDFVVSFILITLLFAAVFITLPKVRMKWRYVAYSAMVSSLLFNIGKHLIGLYLGRASVTNGFGAAGSLIVILLWVYYSSQILYIGAELTKIYCEEHHIKLRPTPDATILPRYKHAVGVTDPDSWAEPAQSDDPSPKPRHQG